MRRYADPDTPYVSRIAPRFVAEQVSDFDHLARVREWSAADEEGEE
jgi:ATP-dependent helicase/nuclease subunit B